MYLVYSNLWDCWPHLDFRWSMVGEGREQGWCRHLANERTLWNALSSLQFLTPTKNVSHGEGHWWGTPGACNIPGYTVNTCLMLSQGVLHSLLRKHREVLGKNHSYVRDHTQCLNQVFRLSKRWWSASFKESVSSLGLYLYPVLSSWWAHVNVWLSQNFWSDLWWGYPNTPMAQGTPWVPITMRLVQLYFPHPSGLAMKMGSGNVAYNAHQIHWHLGT